MKGGIETMKKTLGLILLTLTLMWIMAPLCFAEEAAAATAGKSSNILYYALAALGSGLESDLQHSAQVLTVSV
jgi:hypothetical protein